MLPLFDMLTKSQNGQGLEILARQFNLSQQQAQLAVEALLPAFSQGLKRNTADPYGVGNFMNAMATGGYAKYFENAAQAFSPQGVSQGNDVLGQLFGSKDLSRAVAAQAAQATGLGQQMLQQMLPAVATMIMGGLSKQATNQLAGAQAGGFGGANNPLGQIIQEMMKQGGGLGGLGGMLGGQQAAPQPQANPFDPLGNNPFGKVLQDMFGGAAQQPAPQPQAPQNPLGDNPWGKILQDMLGGGTQASAPQPAPRSRPQEEPAQTPSGRAKNPYDDLFGKMFETGRQQRDDYQKGVESVFDQFLKGMDRNR